MSCRIWLISDTHFGHDNIYTFIGLDGKRIRDRFVGVREGDAYMLERWRTLVTPQDHVYHLGDVTMARTNSQKDAFITLMRSLPGHKRLLRGNHDHFPTKVYLDAGFEEIYGTRKLGHLILSHYPIHPMSIPSWCKANVHGHIHERPVFSERHINVSVEAINYEPVLLDTLYGDIVPKELGR